MESERELSRTPEQQVTEERGPTAVPVYIQYEV